VRPRLHLTIAWLLLGVVVVATTGIAVRYFDGHDFVNNVWAPIRGLLAGYNPYDPHDVGYLDRYAVPIVAGLYVPAALLLHAPLALLSRTGAAVVMALLDALMIWGGVLLLIPPQTVRSTVVAALAGAVVLMSAAAQHTISLAQLSAEAFLGFALVVATLGRGVSPRGDAAPGKRAAGLWVTAIGATLVCLKPQSAIPMLVVLGALGYWRVLGRVALVLMVMSLPGALLFVRAAGSAPAIAQTVRGNLALVGSLPPVFLGNVNNLRVDGLGIVSQLRGPALFELVWMGVAFGASTLLFLLALYGRRARSPVTLGDPYVATLASLYVVGSLYHLTYDQILLYVGPLAAFGALMREDEPSRATEVIAGGGLVLAACGLMFRTGFRNLMMVRGLDPLAVHQAWVAGPTLIAAGIVVAATVADLLKERTSARARSERQ
jgi:hypothetical protein